MTEKLRILIVSHSYLSLENQKNIDQLSKHVATHVVVPDCISDRIHAKVKHIPREGYSAFKRLGLWGSQFFLLSFDMRMREFQPHVVHVEYDSWSTIFWQVALCRTLFARQAKIICTVKNNTYRKYPGVRGSIKHWIARFFIKRCEHFIAVNQGVKDIYQKRFEVGMSKLSVMQHLGVDTNIFSPAQKESNIQKLVVGYCGRFDTEKGVLDLIEAVKNCRERHPEIILKLLGQGELDDKLVGISDSWLQVLKPVPHDQVARFMQSLDIFVLPAHITKDHEEHDAHALLEAIACGVPALGSNSGVIPEVLNDGAGLVFKAGMVQDLSHKLEQLISDLKLREELSNNAIQKVRRHYSVERIAEKKVEIYKQVMNEV